MDLSLFAILPYKLYGDLMVQWLVTRKYIQNAMNILTEGSMEKVTWSYINSLFDHHFKDMLAEKDFLHIVSGLHRILDKTVKDKYNIGNSGKQIPQEKVVVVQNILDTDASNEGPSLLQQRHNKNRVSEKSKSASYDKEKVKDILSMASQLSGKLDISIVDAFDKAEDILNLSQRNRKESSRSHSHSHSQAQQGTTTQLLNPVSWHTVDSPEKIVELACTIKALLDAKLKPKVNPKKI
ncbi:hypothetical protein AX15_006474 [Amanita polypyramis BW_CC]|nr:hypothetical protein AX15_006474 [Amanita polypyramis BW_CC]